MSRERVQMRTWAGVAVVAATMAACGGDDAASEFTAAELAKIQTMSPLGTNLPSTTNIVADNADAAALGQKLFWDKRYSGPLAIDSAFGSAGESGKVNCAACHDPAAAWADSR